MEPLSAPSKKVEKSAELAGVCRAQTSEKKTAANVLEEMLFVILAVQTVGDAAGPFF